jgi:importin subunit beta-1
VSLGKHIPPCQPGCPLLISFKSDLADAFPNGELANYFRNDWVTALVRETRTTRQYSERTIETARWTREQVKRQINMGAGMS